MGCFESTFDHISQIKQYIQRNENTFITGGAGVGKSFTLNEIIRFIKEKYPQKVLAKTAMTGMASLQYEDGGQTLHSCLGLGIYKNLNDLKSITESKYYRSVQRYAIEAIDVLLVDEISMKRSDLMELINALLKYTMNNELPFGGKLVILSGDFMQLCPIVKPEENLPNYWAFQSEAWKELNLNIVNLTEIKRQNDGSFARFLSMIRMGNITKEVNDYFAATSKHVIPDGVKSVKLLSTNDAVNRLNRSELDKCSTASEEIWLKADVWAISDKFRDVILRDCPANEILELRPNCQIMILVNDKNGGYVNGSMGTYLEKMSGRDINGKPYEYLRVRLLDSDMVVNVSMNEWKMEKTTEDGVKRIATFKQFPIKLAYAITIHKSQGMSIDYLEVDLKNCFADHMAYVALSRARTYEGLRIVNWNPRSIKINREALNFYKNLEIEMAEMIAA